MSRDFRPPAVVAGYTIGRGILYRYYTKAAFDLSRAWSHAWCFYGLGDGHRCTVIVMVVVVMHRLWTPGLIAGVGRHGGWSSSLLIVIVVLKAWGIETEKIKTMALTFFWRNALQTEQRNDCMYDTQFYLLPSKFIFEIRMQRRFKQEKLIYERIHQ